MELNYPDDYIIETERLVLRPPTPDDLDRLWPHVTDARITEFLAWDPHTDKTVTLSMINALRDAQLAGRGYHWLIVVNGSVAGLISLIDIRRQHRAWVYNRAELSYWLGPAFQGKGYVTEASRAVVAFGFGKLCLHKIILGHAVENIASRKVALRLGFNEYAKERDAFQKQEVWHALRWYDLLESEFMVTGNQAILETRK